MAASSSIASAAGWASDMVGSTSIRKSFFGQAIRKAIRLTSSDELGVEDPEHLAAVFLDAEAMKRKIRDNLFKETYDVSKFYKTAGLWQAIARSPWFDKFTLLVIALNAVWIGVDTDYNTAEILITADPEFQIAEHLFCSFFAFEWWVRFQAFKVKLSGLRDGWFVFDSLLVALMILETWGLTMFVVLSGASAGAGMGNASILRMARLARLSRMARMARLIRKMPELMILIKGIAAATRSVFFTLCLLCLLLYIFAVAFTQLTVDTEVGELFFPDMASSMYTLLVCGTLMDNIGGPLKRLGQLGWVYGAIYLLFVLLATVTVMNMLIGVLCEVVSTVAAVERETLAVNYVKDRLLTVLQQLDEDGNGTISKDEFGGLLDSAGVVETLNDVGIDVVGLTEFVDVIFQDEEDPNATRELSFGQFLEMILQFRGSNVATVKDVVDFHKYVKHNIGQTTEELRSIKEQLRMLTHSSKYHSKHGKGMHSSGSHAHKVSHEEEVFNSAGGSHWGSEVTSHVELGSSRAPHSHSGSPRSARAPDELELPQPFLGQGTKQPCAKRSDGFEVPEKSRLSPPEVAPARPQSPGGRLPGWPLVFGQGPAAADALLRTVKVAGDLRTDSDGTVCYKDSPFQTSAGFCTAKAIQNGIVS